MLPQMDFFLTLRVSFVLSGCNHCECALNPYPGFVFRCFVLVGVSMRS